MHRKIFCYYDLLSFCFPLVHTFCWKEEGMQKLAGAPKTKRNWRKSLVQTKLSEMENVLYLYEECLAS